MIAQSIEKFGLAKGQKVICAVSGGVDSMVLMDALQNHGLNVIVAHVNHQLRPESHQESSWLERQARQRNLTFELALIHIDKNKNIQHQAHWKRLDFYQKIAAKHHTNLIFLAHHLNDQLEHFLMRLLRGDQPYSWSGMESSRAFLNLKLYRPFLAVPKQQLMDYALHHNISYVEDLSNQSLKYFRNRVRHLLIPKIIEKNPRFLDVFPTLLNTFNTAFKIDFTMYQQQGFYYLDENFYHLQKPIHQHYILQSLIQAQHTSSHLSEKHFDMIHHRLLKDQSPVSFQISSDIFLIRQYQMVGTYSTSNHQPFDLQINEPGTYPLNHRRQIIVSTEKIRHPYINEIELCYNETTFPMRIRFAVQGDVMQFNYGHKPLKKIFAERKIPTPLRRSTYIVETQEGIVGILSLSLQKDMKVGSKKIYIYEVFNVT